MVAKWENREAGYKEVQVEIKRNSSSNCAAQVDLFVTHYKACQALEEKLSFATVKARSNGVDGDDLTAFRKDKGFHDAYKLLDKEVDLLWKEQVKARQMRVMARQTSSDLKILTEHIEEDRKIHAKELDEAQELLKKEQAKAKSGKGTIAPSTVKLVDTLEKEFKKHDPGLAKLLKDIADDTKDLAKAYDVYKNEVDQKMDNYAAKFAKMIANTLDLAPKAGGADESGLPTVLQARVLVVAVKKAVALGKVIEKHCRAAVENAQKERASAAPELKAARTGLDTLKKTHKVLAANRKKHAAAIKKAKESKELFRQFKLADEAFSDAEKALVAAMKTIAGVK